MRGGFCPAQRLHSRCILLRHPGRQRCHHLLGLGAAAFERPIAPSDLAHRGEQPLLLAGADDGCMRGFEVRKLLQKSCNEPFRIGRLEHVRAHECRQRIDFLQRNRLLEQVERLHLPDAEALAEIAAIERIIVVGMDEVVGLEAASERPHVADAREALGNRKRLVREHVEARGRRGTLGLVPENLRERDGAAIVFVGKDAENHAVLVLVAQRLGTAAALRRRMVRIVAAHIGIERALLRTRIGRLVVRHAARRHEERDDGIDER